MGFHNGAYATVWSAEPGKFGNTAKVRLSISRRDKKTGEYKDDFSGFVDFLGDAASAALGLKEKDRIKLNSCDVSNSFNKGTKTGYVNYKVFDFEMAGSSAAGSGKKPAPKTKKAAFADEGETEEDNLPF